MKLYTYFSVSIGLVSLKQGQACPLEALNTDHDQTAAIVMTVSELQIIWSSEDNPEITFLNICCNPSFELSLRHN